MCAAGVATEFGSNRPGQETILCMGRDSLRQRFGACRADLFRRTDEDSGRTRRHRSIHRATKTEVGGEVSASMDYEIAPEELKVQQEAGGGGGLLDVPEPWVVVVAKKAGRK